LEAPNWKIALVISVREYFLGIYFNMTPLLPGRALFFI